MAAGLAHTSCIRMSGERAEGQGSRSSYPFFRDSLLNEESFGKLSSFLNKSMLDDNGILSLLEVRLLDLEYSLDVIISGE